jgi:hypothetical protein
MPYITVYTKATGSGDAASWYKSRKVYTFSGTPATNTKYLGFANLGATSPNSYNNNLLNLVADNTLSRGDYANTEDILTIVITSSSLASTCEFVANKLGVITGSDTQEFLFMPPSSVADLSGYATTNALSTEVSRAQDAEATLTSSVTALSNTISQIATPDLSGYATTAALTTLETQVAMSTSDISALEIKLNDKAPFNAPSFTGTATAEGFRIPNGSSSQFLMADGSVSTSTGGGATVNEAADEFTAATSQSSFTLTQTPAATSRVKMYINGIRISNGAYGVNGTTVTYFPDYNGAYVITDNDRIQFDYSY